MTPRVFLIADTHFGHANICAFTNADGSKVRPWTDVAAMDEALVENWNRVVTERDKVYHLGDVAISHKALPILARCNGRKVLIRGNHDTAKLSQYIPYFKDVRAYHVLDRLILSHVPIHPGSMARFRGNVHGHLHGNVVPGDSRYLCVSVEHINYTPVEFSEITVFSGFATRESPPALCTER